MKMALALLLAFALSTLSFAGCAEGAYSQACETCFANATGIQAQQECFDSMSAEIVACYSRQYPMLVVASSGNECPEMNECLGTSNSCLVSAGVVASEDICGNDGIISCMRGLDSCMESADVVCKPRGEAIIGGEVEKGIRGVCPCIGWLALVGGALLICRR